MAAFAKPLLPAGAVGLRVLSLFDGMSCGQQALERIGVNVLEYYASEIDDHITDNGLDIYHRMYGQEDFFDYFKLVPNTDDSSDPDENEAINFATWYSGMSKDKVIKAIRQIRFDSLFKRRRICRTLYKNRIKSF